MKARISQLIIKHVEKAVVAFALLFFIFLVVRASKLGGDFDKQPDQLQKVSVEAKTAIDDPTTPGPSPSRPIWSDIATGIKEPVRAGPYGIEKTWMHNLFPGETLRGQPEVFPVESLRASTGFGGIAVSASAGSTGSAATMGPSDMEGGGSGYGGYGAGGSAEGHRWVVVTGLLPYKKQWSEYGNLFRNAEWKDRQRDVPSYTLYEVERAEVTPGVEPKPEAWKRLGVLKEFYTRPQKWAGARPEIVYGKFIHRSAGVSMAFPLPPIVDKSFGPEIAHEPEIPLYYKQERTEKEEEEIDWEALADDPKALAEARLNRRGVVGGGGGSGAGYGNYEQNYGEDMMSGGMMDGGMMDGGMMDGGMMDGGMRDGGGSGGGDGGMGGNRMAGQGREIPEYQLFRFFDFNVQPGRYYQYRVRLSLANPNYQLSVQYLDDETLADEPTLVTAWSGETKLISVPLDSRVLAGPVTVSSNINVAPRAELGTVFFNEEDGQEVAEKFAITRGKLMNYLGVVVKEEKPATGMGGSGGDMYGMDDMYPGGPGGSGGSGGSGGGRATDRGRDRNRRRDAPEVIKTVDYVTQMLVLDMSGGASLPGPDRNLRVPGRVLLMDMAGNLVLQNELANQEEWVEFFPPKVKEKDVKDDPYGGMEGSGGGSGMEAEY